MKRKINHAMLVAGSILFCLFIFSYAYWNGGTVEETTRVSVVLHSQNSEQWEVLRQGMERFAKENAVEVNYIALTGRESIWELMETMQREVQNGAEGIILNLPDRDALIKQMNDTLSQTRLVLVDSFLPLNFKNSYIAPDNKAMGKELGNAVLEDLRPGERVGVIAGNIDMQANQERLGGVKESLGEQIAFVASEPEGVSKELWNKAERLICLDVCAGEKALEAVKDEDKILYTIGRTEQLVYYMDKGVVDTMLVTDEFLMGYKALKNLYWELRYYAESENETIPYVRVDRENLYTEENEAIMFPFVQ